MRSFVLVLLFITSCSHRPASKPEEPQRVVILAPESSAGQKRALKEAEKYCEQFDKVASMEKKETNFFLQVESPEPQRVQWAMSNQTRRSDLSQYAGMVEEAMGSAKTTEITFVCL